MLSALKTHSTKLVKNTLASVKATVSPYFTMSDFTFATARA